MKPRTDSRYAREMIKCMMETQDNILKIPELSSKQKEDLMNLRQRLHVLNLETEDAKIKPLLIDVLNNLN